MYMGILPKVMWWWWGHSYLTNSAFINLRNSPAVRADSPALRLNIRRRAHFSDLRFKLGNCSKMFSVVLPRCNGVKVRVKRQLVYMLYTYRPQGFLILRWPTMLQISINVKHLFSSSALISLQMTAKTIEACQLMSPLLCSLYFLCSWSSCEL